MNLFRRYAAYYDLLYGDKDYASEAEYVRRTVRSEAPDANRVLEFGSGTGRHGKLLARAGFDVLGVERSEEMVAAAQAEDVSRDVGPGSFRCMAGDVLTVRVPEKFDAVVALFHVVSYQVRNEDLASIFENAARHLRPRGIFLFDVWHGPAVLSQRPSVRVKVVEDEHTLIRRIAQPEMDLTAGVVTVRYTILAESKLDRTCESFEESHRMRYLFPTEIAMLAAASGFEVRRMEEFGTGRAASESTWGVAYALRKTS